MRPTACAFLPQASAGENKEIWALCGQLLLTARYESQRHGREGDGVWSGVYAHRETITSCPHHHTELQYQHSSL